MRPKDLTEATKLVEKWEFWPLHSLSIFGSEQVLPTWSRLGHFPSVINRMEGLNIPDGLGMCGLQCVHHHLEEGTNEKV